MLAMAAKTNFIRLYAIGKFNAIFAIPFDVK
jgi:hypothetical protein